jgi:hypothetical protein
MTRSRSTTIKQPAAAIPDGTGGMKRNGSWLKPRKRCCRSFRGFPDKTFTNYTGTHDGVVNELTIAKGICVAFVRILSFSGTVCAVFGAENRNGRQPTHHRAPQKSRLERKNPLKAGAKNISWFFCDSFLKNHFHFVF